MKIPLNKCNKVVKQDRIPMRVISDKELKGNKGLGDYLHKMFTPIRKLVPALENCQGCKKRREELNKLFPFKPDGVEEENGINPS